MTDRRQLWPSCKSPGDVARYSRLLWGKNRHASSTASQCLRVHTEAWRAGFPLTPGNPQRYASPRNPPPNPRRTGVPSGRPPHHGPPGHRGSFVPSLLQPFSSGVRVASNRSFSSSRERTAEVPVYGLRSLGPSRLPGDPAQLDAPGHHGPERLAQSGSDSSQGDKSGNVPRYDGRARGLEGEPRPGDGKTYRSGWKLARLATSPIIGNVIHQAVDSLPSKSTSSTTSPKHAPSVWMSPYLDSACCRGS
jgi:hypothetical protein